MCNHVCLELKYKDNCFLCSHNYIYCGLCKSHYNKLDICDCKNVGVYLNCL